MAKTKVETRLGRHVLSIETGRMAKQTDGAVLVQYGDTVVLVAAVHEPMEEVTDMLPLRVDYREMTYAAGKFPGGFWKREGRPTQKEILTARLMDRPIRPLFPDDYHNNLVLTGVVLSADKENDPDVLSMIGASAAMTIAPTIPFQGPIGAVRVAKVNGEYIINPTTSEVASATLELVVAGTSDAITMLEGFGKEVSEDELLQAILVSQKAISEIVRLQKELAQALGVNKPAMTQPAEHPLASQFEAAFYDRVAQAHVIEGKLIRKEAMDKIFKDAVATYAKPEGPTAGELHGLFDKLQSKICRNFILQGKREDGRGLKDLRNITCEVGVLPRVHGSALFTRGETQALVTCTLGSSSDEQVIDGLGEEYRKKFMLDYNFPPFSVHEARPPRAPSRREIGHGRLAEISVKQALPPVEQFPYTIRIVSEILESNGSSSQASVCGGTLALMDAGVPMTNPVAGVAMGLVQEAGQIRILTDISGSEDHYGDMDMKIAGTVKGITGIQMDLKVMGIREDQLMEAFLQAREAREQILAKMAQAIAAPRPQISQFAPRLLLVKIPVDKIGAVIGPGGKVIKKIQEETGATLDIADDGTVNISSVEAAGAERARDIVESLTQEPKVGKIYTGRVTGVKEFGAFVEILPGRDGLVHISELAEGRTAKVEDVCKIGDEMTVKLLSVDDQGKIRLSRKAALKDIDKPKA